MQYFELLNTILKKRASSQLSNANILNSVCIFDLDSTLFNVSPRTEKIIHEFAKKEQNYDLSHVQVQSHHWGLKEALIDSGISFEKNNSEQVAYFEKLKESWKVKFFSNEYLHYDVPYLGAVHFLQTLDDHHIPIFYLTGRDQHRMGKDTSVVLEKWGFPIQSTDRLILKPHREMIDREYKLNELKKMSDQFQNSQLYFFENEPVIINHVSSALPKLQIIYMNTTHSRTETVQAPVITLEHFE